MLVTRSPFVVTRNACWHLWTGDIQAARQHVGYLTGCVNVQLAFGKGTEAEFVQELDGSQQLRLKVARPHNDADLSTFWRLLAAATNHVCTFTYY
jgi:hypothetical protein